MSAKLIQPSTSAAAAAVTCRRVSVHFAGRRQAFAARDAVTVLNHLDLSVQPGEIVTLLGPSGCGKSTLLRAVAGLQRLSEGSIELGGPEFHSSRPKLAFVFQEPALLPWRTVVDNVRLPLELTNAKSPTTKDDVTALLTRVGLGEQDFSKLPAQLSGGMKMRASLARALITDPEIMLLDEPFAALDDMLRTKLNELLLQLWADRTRTILFVTHNIAEALFLSHRIAIMSGGKIKRIFNVDFPLPRSLDIRSSTEFAQNYGMISNELAEAAR